MLQYTMQYVYIYTDPSVHQITTSPWARAGAQVAWLAGSHFGQVQVHTGKHREGVGKTGDAPVLKPVKCVFFNMFSLSFVGSFVCGLSL